MKDCNRIKIVFFLLLTIVFVSCSKDNYDAPSSTFKGRMVYNGDPVGVEDGQVYFELWQPGFGKNGSINVAIAQDGTFSSSLFNGNYKLVVPNAQGPFFVKRKTNGQPDTLQVDISGNKTMDIEVTPYYIIKNPQVTAIGKIVNAKFAVEKIINDTNGKALERVSLYINKTQFVAASGTRNIANASINGSAITDLNNISLSVTIPEIVPIQNYVFARVGIKVAGVEDMLYSKLEKINY